jgi:hypothetical protein
MDRFFILVLFWCMVVGLLRRLYVMVGSEYPRTQTFSVGYDTAATIENLAWIFWAAYLLWGAR